MKKKKIFIYVWWYVHNEEYHYSSAFNYYSEDDCIESAKDFVRLRERDGFVVEYEIKSFEI